MCRILKIQYIFLLRIRNPKAKYIKTSDTRKHTTLVMFSSEENLNNLGLLECDVTIIQSAEEVIATLFCRGDTLTVLGIVQHSFKVLIMFQA